MYVTNHTYQFMYFEPLLNHWFKLNLVIINDHIGVILNLICEYFLRVLQSCSFKKLVCSFSFPFLMGVFIFGSRVILSL